MVAALTVAALLVRLGINNPAALAVPAPVQARAVALVVQLGDRQFSERDAASRELEGMGRLALPAVRAGRSSADAEVRLRCERLLPPMEGEELSARLSVFVADDAGKYDHRIPGWEVFRAAAGDDRPARDLFAEIVRDHDNRPLLTALRGPGLEVRAGLLAAAGGVGAWADRPPPGRAAQAAAVRRWQFYARREAPPGLEEFEAPRRPGPTVPEVALVVLAETLHPERMTVRSRPPDFVNSYFGVKVGRDALTGEGRFGPAFARLGRRWLDTRDGVGAPSAYALGVAIKIDTATLDRYAARVVGQQGPASGPRAQCLARLVADRATEYLGVVLAQFDDAEPLDGGLFRDWALLAALAMTGQSAEEYGVDAKLTGTFKAPPGTDTQDIGAAVSAERAATFGRWRQWEATQFGAVAGSAVIVGARPGR